MNNRAAQSFEARHSCSTHRASQQIRRVPQWHLPPPAPLHPFWRRRLERALLAEYVVPRYEASSERKLISRKKQLLIAPLTFLSFLLSLALIDSRNHSLRTHVHKPPRAPPSTLLGRAHDVVHALLFRQLDAAKGPYEVVGSSPGAGRGMGKQEPWHWHTKQKKLMRAELEDAFKLRKWVVVCVLMGLAVGVAGVVVVGGWVGGVLGGLMRRI